MRNGTFDLGDRVAFSSRFLTSIQAHELGRAMGTVMQVESIGGARGPMLVSVKWSDGVTTRCLSANLVLASRIHLEAV